MLQEDYEFYHIDEYVPPYHIATIEQAIDDFDLINESGRYEPTLKELFDRMRPCIARKSDEWLMNACKRWIKQSRKLREMHLREEGLI